jgi:hypothetical protein
MSVSGNVRCTAAEVLGLPAQDKESTALEEYCSALEMACLLLCVWGSDVAVYLQVESTRPTHEEVRLEMPTVRVVLKNPEQGETQKMYHEVEAHISTNNVLHVTRGGGDAIAEFQADAYLYWEYVEVPTGQHER